MTSSNKYIYTFGARSAEGSASMKTLLGGKGAGLAEMCRLGLPVPPGFTITTEVCNYYYEHEAILPSDFKSELLTGLKHIEKIMGRKFGDPENPLLVSVRSGARASMPGMMDTILNLGGMEKLWEALQAVFQSWMGKRAQEYRRIHRIPNIWGTACTVQAMVFGNMGETSGTGVLFNRNPATGEGKLFGEYLANAQGEEIVAGVRTPEPIEKLEESLPNCYAELERIAKDLEKHYRDMQDLEFTIEEGKLWMLQTRRGKRTAAAAVKIAVDMVSEGLITKEEALMRVEPSQIDQLLHPMISPSIRRKSVARGLPASPGAAVGRVVFTADDAVAWVEKKEPVILVRAETSPEDIHGMNVAKGILTSLGGITSHAAVVARGMGKVCVVGCGEMTVEEPKKRFCVNSHSVQEGDWITIDGTTGEVMLEKLPTVEPTLSQEFHTLMGWADRIRKLKVKANAETPKDVAQAKEFGAEGIGLCRTEHMFFESERIPAVRQMILSDTMEERKKALSRLKPMQKKDFSEIFKLMEGFPVTIRLLDPPLHEFVPHSDEEIKTLSHAMEIPFEKLKARVEDLKEVNPMLGLRGCRLGLLYPEIYEMQIEAIMEAACELVGLGVEVLPEIEMPLVGLAGEIRMLREMAEKICLEVCGRFKQKVDYKIGTMVETPRAAFRADTIAAYADFFSFGTNDLTQTTMGISRDDSFKFVPLYEQKGLVKTDPFRTIDFEGVGELMKICVAKARQTKPDMTIGICGEHGGDPESIYFCHEIGLDYVSCSPYRIPVARLAAARAVLSKRFEHN